MKLDRNKRYEGLGLTLQRDPSYWVGRDGNGKYLTADDEIMQAWLDWAYIKPVRETKIVRVEGVRMVKPPSGNLYSEFRPTHYDELPDGAMSKPVTLEFEVDA